MLHNSSNGWPLLLFAGAEWTQGLFAGFADIGGAVVEGEDDLVFLTEVIVERDLELVGESVDDSGANTEARKGAWTRHEGEFGEICPSFAVFFEFVLDETYVFFGEVFS